MLEHIEPEFLDDVVDDLSVLTKHLCFLTVHVGEAKKVLSDGRNAPYSGIERLVIAEADKILRCKHVANFWR